MKDSQEVPIFLSGHHRSKDGAFGMALRLSQADAASLIKHCVQTGFQIRELSKEQLLHSAK